MPVRVMRMRATVEAVRRTASCSGSLVCWKREVIPRAKAGEDGVVDLDEAAFIGCREEIERGEAQTEQDSEKGVQRQA